MTSPEAINVHDLPDEIANNPGQEPTHGSQRYWLGQCLFWGGSAGLSLAMTGIFGSVKSAAVTVPVLLACLCLPASHGLRLLYKRYAQQLSLTRVLLHALWLLPTTALIVQILMYLILTAVVTTLPALVNGFLAYQWPYFFAYVANTTMLLTLWAAIYLMLTQFRRRQQAQTAYWQSQIQLRDTELQFLHSQINSHFLFNAINNLRALIREDPERARDGLSQLAEMLRAVLQSESRDQISIGKELKLVQAYLALESLQLESRLQIDWQIDERCLDTSIPPLLIQTLVENAVTHGIARRPDGGLLRIIVSQVDSAIRITVSNPASNTNNYMADSNRRSGNGIGLVNARKRLHALFGTSASLQLQAHDGIMMARVSIPL